MGPLKPTWQVDVALLEVRNLTKTFPAPTYRGVVWAVNDVSFDVNEGTTLGLVGESGSGKTTVGRCIVGLAKPSSGAIRFEDVDMAKAVSRKSLLRSRIQIVFQEPYDALNPRRTIGEAIKEPLEILRDMTRADRMQRVIDVSESLGLTVESLVRFPHELSAGVLQRAGIARAMVTDPRLLILDEPTSLLDPTARADIIELLISRQESTGVSYVFISHDLSSVRHISHELAVMYLGQVVESGPATTVFANPQHPYTKSLLSAILPPRPTERRSEYRLHGEIPSPIDLPSGCFLHARCPIAIADCSIVRPELKPIDDGVLGRCIRLPDYSAPGHPGDAVLGARP
ncbi:MAG: ATP-binding cassette domain-containing protein [Nitrospiraceae bacterium]|nr:ATP-binding cassette domain-containing protein [Nitrospiraceae bacterium]